MQGRLIYLSHGFELDCLDGFYGVIWHVSTVSIFVWSVRANLHPDIDASNVSSQDPNGCQCEIKGL